MPVITTKALVPLGALGLAVLFGRKRKKGRAKAQECPPFAPLQRDAILKQAEVALSQGLKGVGRVAAFVGATLFATDTQGRPIAWPTTPPFELPQGTPDSVICLFAEIKIIIQELPIPPAPEAEGEKPGEVLTDLLASKPTAGKFFKMVKGGPNALGQTGVTGQVLNRIKPGAGNEGQNRLRYLHLMSQPNSWNIDKYGRDRVTQNWPAFTLVDGLNIAPAWMPVNVNAIRAITEGRDPPRNIDITGKKVGTGSSFGLLWLPPIDEDALRSTGTITLATLKWSDGSPVINPPPELTRLLQA